MIGLRLTQNDVAIRYFQAIRDGEPIFIQTVGVRLRSPGGVTKVGEGVIEDGGEGEFFVTFGSTGLELSEVGEYELEFLLNGQEHAEEPMKVWVRPEFVRGPQ